MGGVSCCILYRYTVMGRNNKNKNIKKTPSECDDQKVVE